jgi:dipeptidyl aminopeptidase/acylaminoacyl peptidase
MLQVDLSAGDGAFVARDSQEKEMYMVYQGLVKRIALIVAMLVIAGVAYADTVDLNEWLVAGPVMLPHAVADPGSDIDAVDQWLTTLPLDPFDFWPSDGDVIQLGVGKTATFHQSEPALPVDANAKGVQFALFASYLSSPAWQQGTINISSDVPFALFVDGEAAISHTSYEVDAEAETYDVILDQGHHRLLLAFAVPQGQDVADGAFSASYELGEDQPTVWMPMPTLNPVHPYDLIDYYWTESVSGLEISHDGRWLAVDLGKRSRKDDKTRDRLEVWNTKNKERIWSYQAAKGVSNLAWSPDNTRLLFKSGENLFVWHRDQNRVERIETVLDGGQFRWSADGAGLFYLKTMSADENEENYQVMWGLRDRWSSWRDDSALHYFAFDSGLDVELLVMQYKPESWTISRDGRHIAFARTLPEVERPFEIMDILLFDLQTGEAKSVYQGRFQRDEFANIVISGDGSWIAFVAPVQEVSGNDTLVPDVNSSHHALWVLNANTGEARRVAPEFEKAIDFFYYRTGYDNGFVWHADGYVAFTAAYEGKLYYCTWMPGTDEITSQLLSTPGFSYLSISSGRGSNMVAYQADVSGDLPDIHVMDIKRDRGGLFIKINEDLRRLTNPTQRVEAYDYINSDGVRIFGYLYYPHNYDETKSYPLVVDTYGGVIGFGDSWLWFSQVMACRGYFVYVPSPRGAVGFGQEYADTHVNDWGTLTSRDMNEGVRNIAENVPGVDGERCGFASGSYGGFLAMYLLTIPEDHPDYYPYVTTISNYGISNLASYWGIGWWGAYYSEKASAGSYPWNKPEWYVSQSPLFQADEITEPMLLLHGEADTNVPVGESEQMYTALKLLNRDVVYIKYPGENHGIASTRTKYLETKRMHIEWFDKYLRDQPGAWDKRMEDEFQK